MVIEFLKTLGSTSIRAEIAHNAPVLFKGFINEFFALNDITPETAISMVEQETSLWHMVKPESCIKIEKALDQIGGNLNWFSVDWLLEAIKEKHKALFSLFVTWPEGKDWLAKQIEEIKAGIEHIEDNEAG